MEKMLTELCAELNNYFWRAKVEGNFVIENGVLTSPFLKDGQYFRVVGSLLNDGVYKYPVSDMIDEEFEGALWSMAVPQAVIDLASEISEWIAKYGTVDAAAMSPFSSESFGNYSYSKGSVSSGSAGSGNPNSWQAVYAPRLSKWRRMRGMP